MEEIDMVTVMYFVVFLLSFFGGLVFKVSLKKDSLGIFVVGFGLSAMAFMTMLLTFAIPFAWIGFPTGLVIGFIIYIR
ncbi:MAG: hypothetical protein ABIJ91_02590 [Candidatus Kuenenbacteria bacterium]